MRWALALLVIVAAVGCVAPGTETPLAADVPSGSGVKAILLDPVEDMPVSFRGIIVRRAYREHYVFTDGTGEILLDIDDDYLPRGTPVTPGMAVAIAGLVDRKLLRPPEIEVHTVTPL
jgi:uncharacterized protein (TIGR00156 family)